MQTGNNELKFYEDCFSKEELTELYLFMTAAVIEYCRKPNSTMYQLCKLVDIYRKIGRLMKEMNHE